MTEQVKIAVVGASALRGKELTEVLEETKFGSAEIALLDEDDALGQLETVGDEIALVARVEAESFQGMDYVFFAGTQDQTRQHWQNAAASHASIVDMTGALGRRGRCAGCGSVGSRRDRQPGDSIGGSVHTGVGAGAYCRDCAGFGAGALAGTRVRFAVRGPRCTSQPRSTDAQPWMSCISRR